MARIVEFIETESFRGSGTEADPNRLCPQLWTKDGGLIAEYDPFEEASSFNPQKGINSWWRRDETQKLIELAKKLADSC
jgi:hypothetical protein